MLTLKVVWPTGYEDIYEVRRASLGKMPNPNPQSSDDGFIDVVWGEMENGENVPFNDGTIYVMNDNGKTVANYHLEDPRPPRFSQA